MSLATLDDHQKLWDGISARRAKMEAARLAPPRIRLWNGDMVLRGEVAGERAGEYEFIENDVGTATIELSLDHYLAKWIMGFRGRDKRNVIVTIDKQGSRWSGTMDYFRVVYNTTGDAYLEVVFLHDLAHARSIYCWSNPFLRAELQFPKLWFVFGPAKWCLLLTLFVNLFRLETSLWTLPDDPLDPTEWMGPSFFPRFWRQVVKPFSLLADNSPLTLVWSRFQSFFDVAQRVLRDAQLTLVCRRYLHGEDPHPFADLAGFLGLPAVEDLFTKMPLRHGVLVWDIQDNSAWGEGTSFGGSLLTGLVRAIVNVASDGMTEGIDIVTGDATFPGEYYEPGWLGTRPQAPWVVFEDSAYTGIKSSEFTYHEATSTSFLTGGRSMPGVVCPPGETRGGMPHLAIHSERGHRGRNQYRRGLPHVVHQQPTGGGVYGARGRYRPPPVGRHDQRGRVAVGVGCAAGVHRTADAAGRRIAAAAAGVGASANRFRGVPLPRVVVRGWGAGVQSVGADGDPGEDVGNQGACGAHHRGVRRGALHFRGDRLRACVAGLEGGDDGAGFP